MLRASSCILLLIAFFPTSLFADVIDPLYSSHCFDFDTQYAYVGTPLGINVFDKRENSWLDLDVWISEKRTVTAEEEPYARSINVLSVLADSNQVWVAVGERGGVFKIDLDSDKMEWWRNPQKDLIAICSDSVLLTSGDTITCPYPSNTVVSIRNNRIGNVLFATLWGIAELDGKRWRVFPAYHPYAEYEEKSMIDASITSLVIDNRDRWWIGISDFYFAYYESEGSPETESDVNGGLVHYNGKIWKHFYAYDYNLKQEDNTHIKVPLMSNDVTCVEADGDDIWIGTKYGVNVYDTQGNLWRTYDKEDCTVFENGISSIAASPKFVWIASWYNIARYDKDSDEWSIVGKEVLPFGSFRSIGYDRYADEVWAVSSQSYGRDVYVYRYKQGNWTVYPTKERVTLEEPDELIKLGMFLKRHNFQEGAKSTFSKFIELYPDHTELVHAKYELLLLEGLNEKVVEEFQLSNPSSHYSVKLYYDLAQLFQRGKKWNKALRYFQIYVENTVSREDIFKAKNAMTKCYRAVGEYEKEAALLETLYYAYPEEERKWGFRGKIGNIYKDKIHDYWKAIEWYRKKLTIGLYTYGIRTSDETLLKIGECFERLGEYDSALVTYGKIQNPRLKETVENRIKSIKDK